jgi:hypothetical protein
VANLTSSAAAAAAAAAAAISLHVLPGGLLKIEDILPFFPDFVTIDNFKGAITDSLTRYNRQIEDLKGEMDEATEIAGEHSCSGQASSSYVGLRLPSPVVKPLCNPRDIVTGFTVHPRHSPCYLDSSGATPDSFPPGLPILLRLCGNTSSACTM